VPIDQICDSRGTNGWAACCGTGFKYQQYNAHGQERSILVIKLGFGIAVIQAHKTPWCHKFAIQVPQRVIFVPNKHLAPQVNACINAIEDESI
jgi:hypothetical protein